MALQHCTADDRKLIGECLTAAVEGPFFPDWEFSTLFGLDRADVAEVRKLWPNVSDEDQRVALAVSNTLGNLIGYPHRQEKEWSRFISVPPEHLAEVLKRWQRPPGVP